MLKKSQNFKIEDTGKDKAIKIATSNEDPEMPLRVEIPYSYHKALKKLKGNADEYVTIKLLIIESLEDIFNKYIDGKGKYPMDDNITNILRRELKLK
ncbi:hypothetical protein [Zooshikella sp. RANM57]|uniref:hypothetical protein n=1 Tax=Zooshikella sp. RANM57 TaxID=3425863 RepID=UPI003D6DEE2D